MPVLTTADRPLAFSAVKEPKVKKKIAFIFNRALFQGGGEISFFELIKGLDRDLFEPLVILPAKGEIEIRASDRGIEVIVCPFPSLRSIGNGKPLWTPLKLAGIFRQNKVDLIHANGSRACFYSGIAGRLLAIPVIWHVRETIRDLFVYDNFLAYLSAAIITVSKSVKAKRFGKSSSRILKKIHISYNGVDTCHFTKNRSARNKIRRRLNAGDRTLFGIVGNVTPLKGHDIFLKGLAQAKQLQPNLAIKALFIGRYLDEKYKRQLYRLTVDLHLQNTVIFTGYCDDIPKYLSAIDVFALPSQREGCSRALLEAMSAGLPVIASNISEIEEVVSPEKNAILVEYGDVAQMATAITQLAENKKHRETFGRANRVRAQKDFSIKSHVDSIQQVYANIFNKKR